MSDGENKIKAFNPEERFKFIGFEVFPGKAGDIFSSEEERKTLKAKVMASFRRSEGEVREGCTLMEERVSGLEKAFLTVVSVLLLASLVMPWFSGYYEITTERLVPVTTESSAVLNEGGATGGDGAAAMTDSNAVAAVEQPAEAVQETAEAAATEADQDSTAMMASQDPDYVPPGMTKISEIHSEYHSVTGIGALFSLGTFGEYIFSSGFALMLTGVLMIVYFISCLLFGIYNLYIIYGVKKASSDEYALHLKKMLKLNWYPVILWLAMFVLSMIGGSYGFDSSNMVVQVGESYGLGAFVGLSSYGLFVALGAYLILALKGKEI
ncbi:MAG: hypothetical protein R3F48_06995 [Candidatus Zixiibacteriota bacterium]